MEPKTVSPKESLWRDGMRDTLTLPLRAGGSMISLFHLAKNNMVINIYQKWRGYMVICVNICGVQDKLFKRALVERRVWDTLTLIFRVGGSMRIDKNVLSHKGAGRRF